MYRFIAERRDTGEIVTLCEADKLDLFETMMEYFEEGRYVSRFAIMENDVTVKEKILPPKKEGKIKCLKR